LNEDHDGSTIIGHFVTVGHHCRLHACTVEDYCLVGMGSIINEGGYMEKFSMLAAGSVLSPWTRIPAEELWAGNPAKFWRRLTEQEIARRTEDNENYYDLSMDHYYETSYLPYGTAYIEAEKEGIDFGAYTLVGHTHSF